MQWEISDDNPAETYYRRSMKANPDMSLDFRNASSQCVRRNRKELFPTVKLLYGLSIVVMVRSCL